MGIDISGWIEVKISFASYEGEWMGVIKIHPLLFSGFRPGDLRISLHEMSTPGLPADASNEVKADWNPRVYMSPPCVLNWEDAWKMDTEAANSHWWTLVEMVNTLKQFEYGFQTLSIRFVYWSG